MSFYDFLQNNRNLKDVNVKKFKRGIDTVRDLIERGKSLFGGLKDKLPPSQVSSAPPAINQAGELNFKAPINIKRPDMSVNKLFTVAGNQKEEPPIRVEEPVVIEKDTFKSDLITEENQASIIKSIVGAESYGGDEKVFVRSIPAWRRKLIDVDGNWYGDQGRHGWVVGFTIPTYKDIKQKADSGDWRYIELLSKLNFDTSEAAGISAIELMKFKNVRWDANKNIVGYKYDNLEDLYVNGYNASGSGKPQARKNWIKNQVIQ